MATKEITKDECILLTEALGTKTPAGCFALSRSTLDEPFTDPNAPNKFEGRDETHHRNSWLMPRMARRMTRNNKYHVGNWRQAVTVDSAECQRLKTVLAANLDSDDDLKAYLPKACDSL